MQHKQRERLKRREQRERALAAQERYPVSSDWSMMVQAAGTSHVTMNVGEAYATKVLWED